MAGEQIADWGGNALVIAGAAAQRAWRMSRTGHATSSGELGG
jgi:hypothetical protein